MIDLKHSDCFNALPTIVQESIMQSGIDFQTEEDLRKFAAEYGYPQK